MPEISCKYHPSLSARWECHSCQVAFCGGCAKTDLRLNEAQCPICKERLDQVHAGNFIPPFWKCIPQFFLYPANAKTLIFIVIASVGISILSQFIFGLLFLLLFSLGFLRYSMLVLETTAQGKFDPPDAGLSTFTEGLVLPIKQFLVFVVMGFAVTFAGVLMGRPGGFLMLAFVLFTLPASVMVLAVEESFFSAVNPAMLLGMIKRIGFPYIILYVFLLLVNASYATLDAIIASSNLPFLTFIQFATYMYFTLIMYHMMGYVIFQYHEELDYQVNLDVDRQFGEQKKTTATTNQSGIMNEIGILIKEGRQADALNRVRGELNQINSDPKLHDIYHNLLVHSGDQQELIRHGREYINMLLAANNYSRASEVFKRCAVLDKSFFPSDPDKYFALASVLREKRDFVAAVTLINGFHNRFTNHIQIPQLYLLAAAILCEDLEKEQQAMKILSFLNSHYQNHPQSGDISKYSKVVNTVMQMKQTK
ncbi:MAG: DUF4013 domain-containing protein [Gammaproteobacteria bacterium]|nr:DUF4013 domain-containing protein [Gammaproteobacteria bacterium]MDH5801810.1 DUF4013 domain-containing protein [Gammaproteobacteria bacterium]